MKCVLIRHGEKSNPREDAPDIYLSLQGLAQSQDLQKKMSALILPKPTHLYASEIERTQQTLGAASKVFNLHVAARREFDLQDFNESAATFRQRVQRGLEFIAGHPPESVLYVCSHQDWLHEALSLIASPHDLANKDYWPTGRYIEFNVLPNGQWEILTEGRLL